MQNAGMAALKLDWRYLAFEVHPDDLGAALEGAKRMKFIGLNLTVPHKLLAVEMVDVLDESARAWGAVNTVLFEGRDESGVWRPLREFGDAPREVRSRGFNTDAEAVTRALREDLGLEVAGARVLLLGAGGAGRTAALKLASEKAAELFLVNRTRSKAEALAEEIRQRWPRVKVAVGYPPGAPNSVSARKQGASSRRNGVRRSQTIDLVLNATSLGLTPDDPLPLDETRFSLGQAAAVYDTIYRPAETPLLKSAKAAGCRVANGLGMLLYQGAKALEIWSGQSAPLEAMRRALEKNVYA